MLVGCFCNIETDNDIPYRELFYQATNQRETTKYLAIIIQDVSDYEPNILSIFFVTHGQLKDNLYAYPKPS
jgi:hypothetical protein